MSDRDDHFAALQVHTIARARALALPATARVLFESLRGRLRAAADDGLLRTSIKDILKHVVLLDPGPGLAEQLHEQRLLPGAKCIFGGAKNQNRDITLPHLMRDDGAWFDFSITVRETDCGLELLAYDFEIRAAPTLGAPFMRFDLNLPGHDNETRDLRCHLHPGSDDTLVPAPLMSPDELLALFLAGLRLGKRTRAITAFEMDWFRRKVAEVDE